MVPALILLTILACSDGPTANPIRAFNVTPAEATIRLGMSLQLQAAPISNVGADKIIWESSAPTILEVDSTGFTRGKGIGVATIRVSNASGFGETQISVTKVPIGLSSSFSTTCGSASDGSVVCWGRNDAGQAGTGGTDPVHTPAKVAGTTATSSVRAGALHSCAVSASGNFCWGSNAAKELSINCTQQTDVGTCPPIPTPTAVSGGQSFATLEPGGSFYFWGATCNDAVCGARTCALTSQGQLYCWGEYTTPAPVPVSTQARFASLSVSTASLCGISLSADVLCGAFPDRAVNLATLNPVPGTSKGQLVVTGGRHNCMLDLRGVAYCWGYNSTGQLGAPASEVCSRRFVGEFPCRASADSVDGGLRFQTLAVSGGEFLRVDVRPVGSTCGVTVQQEIWCWGDNSVGQLGNGTTTTSQTPVRVTSTEKFVSVAVGSGHACGMTIGGTVYCWGRNEVGQLGRGTVQPSLVPVAIVGGFSFR